MVVAGLPKCISNDPSISIKATVRKFGASERTMLGIVTNTLDAHLRVICRCSSSQKMINEELAAWQCRQK